MQLTPSTALGDLLMDHCQCPNTNRYLCKPLCKSYHGFVVIYSCMCGSTDLAYTVYSSTGDYPKVLE